MAALEIRISIELPTGKREQFGYSWPEHRLDGNTFAPLPPHRELDPMSFHESMMQRERRNRIAQNIGRELAEAILEAAERHDTVRGYSSKTA